MLLRFSSATWTGSSGGPDPGTGNDSQLGFRIAFCPRRSENLDFLMGCPFLSEEEVGKWFTVE
jgi:hypothetical protein